MCSILMRTENRFAKQFDHQKYFVVNFHDHAEQISDCYQRWLAYAQYLSVKATMMS